MRGVCDTLETVFAATLATLAMALPAPAHLHVRARASTTVTLAWRDRARGERRYEVRRGPRLLRRLHAGAKRVRVRGLHPGHRYRFRVRACARARCGRSASIRVRTRAAASGRPRIGGCPVFRADNAWNRDISHDPVDPRSDAYLARLPGNLHPDFGSGRNGDYGIPFAVVARDQPLAPIRFTAYGDESDPGPYPLPPGARVEGGSDRHVLVVQRGACKLYELFGAERSSSGWEAASGAVFDLRSNRSRPAGWTSADAAGLPILPGLARPDEASAGPIRHALRFTVRRTQNAYVDPARHFASSDDSADLPPMGLRFRLRAGFDLGAFHGQSLAILEALKTYGMIVADNGSNWYISGAADPGWDDDDIDQLKQVPGGAFEVVRPGPLHRG
jgi:hypothetical protein